MRTGPKLIHKKLSLCLVISYLFNCAFQVSAFSLEPTTNQDENPVQPTHVGSAQNRVNQLNEIASLASPTSLLALPAIPASIDHFVNNLREENPNYRIDVHPIEADPNFPSGFVLIMEIKDSGSIQKGDFSIATFSIDPELNVIAKSILFSGYAAADLFADNSFLTFVNGLSNLPYGKEANIAMMLPKVHIESFTTGANGAHYINFTYKNESWRAYRLNGTDRINKRRSKTVSEWEKNLEKTLGADFDVIVAPDNKTPFGYQLTISKKSNVSNGELINLTLKFSSNPNSSGNPVELDFNSAAAKFQNWPDTDSKLLIQGLQLLNPDDLLTLLLHTEIESLTVGADGTSYINIIINKHDAWKIYVKDGQVRIGARLPIIIRNYRDDLRKALISGYDVTINFSSTPGQYTVLITPSQTPASGELSNITFNVYENSSGGVSIDFTTLRASYEGVAQSVDPNLLIAGIFLVDPTELYSLTKITVLKVNDDGSVVCVYKNKNYKIYKDSDGEVQIIEIAINVQDAIKKLIDEGVFTAEEYRAFVGNLSFEQMYSLFNQDQNEFMQFIIDNSFLRDDITTVEGLKVKLLAKGIDVDEWDLMADGILSAIQDVRGEGNLFKTPSSNPLNSNKDYRQAIENSFNASKQNFLNGNGVDFTFLNNFSIPSILELLGADEEDAVIKQELYAMLWNNQPNPDLDYLLNQPKLIWDNEKGYFRISGDSGAFTPDEAAAYLATLPEGQRSLLLTGSLYGDLFSYDVLKDANGKTLVDQNGKPYFFPTMDGFIQQINARIGDWFSQLAVALQTYNTVHGTNIKLDNVSLDYERKDTCYWYFRQQFDTNPDPKKANYDFSPLLKDPRLDQILQAVGITREQLLDMGNWNVVDSRYAYAYKWDAYFYTAREQGIYDAFFKPIVEAMPNVQVYNYSSFLHNNINPTDWYSSVINSAGNIGYLFENGIPCVTVYGVPRAIKTIEYPYGIPGSEQISMFERLIGNFDQITTVDSTTNRQVAVWVSTPNVMANYFNDGINMGNSMAEIWYRAGVSAYNFNVWNSTADGGTPEQKAADMLFANNTLKEINEVMGYSDREILRDAEGVSVNGEKVDVDPHFYDFMNTDYMIYGVKANGQNIYRVTLNLGDTHSANARDTKIIDDGSKSGVVKLEVAPGKVLEFKNAHIFHPSVEVSKEGFWIVQDPNTGNLISGAESSKADEVIPLVRDRRFDDSII